MLPLHDDFFEEWDKLWHQIHPRGFVVQETLLSDDDADEVKEVKAM